MLRLRSISRTCCVAVIPEGGLARFMLYRDVMLKRHFPKIVFAMVVLGAVLAVQALKPKSGLAEPGAGAQRPVGTAVETSGQAPVSLDVAKFDLASAVVAGTISTDFVGNGRDKVVATLGNPGAQPMQVRIPAGQMMQGDGGRVTVVRETEVSIPPMGSMKAELHTAAVASSNRIGSHGFELAAATSTRLEPLLAEIAERPEISRGAIQTAVLAITENLPVQAFAKFVQVGSDLPSKFDTTAFKVDAYDIVAALQVLRDSGFGMEQFALAVDPQLRIEAMIDPLSRAMAMRYYEIKPEQEWQYWKSELLSGDAATRHYALYGIARFYPDIALKMLPDWVRETRTNRVLRLSAVQALAETHRREAVLLLRQLQNEFSGDVEIGTAARAAAEYLEAQLKPEERSKIAISFRASVSGL